MNQQAKIYVLVKDGIGYIGNTENCVLLPEIKDNGYWNATIYGGTLHQPHFFLSSLRYELTTFQALALKAKVKLIRAILAHPQQPTGVAWFTPDRYVSVKLSHGIYTHGKIEADLIGRYTPLGDYRLYLNQREAVDIASKTYLEENNAVDKLDLDDM